MDLTDNGDFVLPAKELNDGLQYTKQLVYDGCHVPGMFTKPEQNHNDFQIAIQCQHSGCTIKFLTKASLVNSWISVRICNRTAGKCLDSPIGLPQNNHQIILNISVWHMTFL